MWCRRDGERVADVQRKNWFRSPLSFVWREMGGSGSGGIIVALFITDTAELQSFLLLVVPSKVFSWRVSLFPLVCVCWCDQLISTHETLKSFQVCACVFCLSARVDLRCVVSLRILCSVRYAKMMHCVGWLFSPSRPRTLSARPFSSLDIFMMRHDGTNVITGRVCTRADSAYFCACMPPTFPTSTLFRCLRLLNLSHKCVHRQRVHAYGTNTFLNYSRICRLEQPMARWLPD